ncbi:uncharacterized protein [Dysidea avara]|uniref:uncharacterized protein n=1 Tax=Dysidea avara TaxID=196820 RepID=UPI00332866E5
MPFLYCRSCRKQTTSATATSEPAVTSNETAATSNQPAGTVATTQTKNNNGASTSHKRKLNCQLTNSKKEKDAATGSVLEVGIIAEMRSEDSKMLSKLVEWQQQWISLLTAQTSQMLQN